MAVPHPKVLNLLGGSAALAHRARGADILSVEERADTREGTIEASRADLPRDQQADARSRRSEARNRPSEELDNSLETEAPQIMDPDPFAYNAAEALAARLGEPIETIRRLLRLTDRTWTRRRLEDRQFSVEESDRLYRIARVVQRAIEVFGDEAKARSWLTRPNRTMRLQRPLDLLGSDQGASIVADELNRIDYGDLF